MALELQVQLGPQVLPEVPRCPPEPLQVPETGSNLSLHSRRYSFSSIHTGAGTDAAQGIIL